MAAQLGSKYKHVADMLGQQIFSGRYRVGDVLPSEAELTKIYGVSRNTAREAVRALQDKGLVLKKQGVGSIVSSSRISGRYNYQIDAVAELVQYGIITEQRIIEVKRVKADKGVARWLKCQRDAFCWRIVANRRGLGDKVPRAAAVIYIPDEFGSVTKQLRGRRSTIYSLIEKRFGESVVEIREEIFAQNASALEAAALNIAEGSQMMCIMRSYINAKGRIIEVARSFQETSIFKYTMTLRLKLDR
jgi:GntR family transcriptional regulator